MVVILVIVFWFSVAMQLLYWTLLSKHIPTSITKKTNIFPSVSVIISAKNEFSHLEILLPQIISQNYPNFEIIVINDYSTDKTPALLVDLSDKCEKLVHFTPSKNNPGKKLGISEAISMSSSKYILLTDADCKILSPDWIFSMVSTLSESKKIVLGYGPYHKTRGWVNKFTRFETFLTALQYMGFASLGHAYMGVGRNMLYEKSLFTKSGGFLFSDKISSGDDDLFIQRVATAKNTIVNIDPVSFVYSESEPSISSYINQKMRHMSTASFYKRKFQMLLAILPVLKAVETFLMLGLVLLVCWELVLLTYVIKILLLSVCLAGSMRKLKVIDLLPFLFLLDILHTFYLAFFAKAAFSKKNTGWN